jgi:hypothetical protein
MLKKLGGLWCATFHTNITWPIKGEYWCRDCGRRYQVCWAAEEWSDRSPGEARLQAVKFSFQQVQSKRKWESVTSGEERRSPLGQVLRRAYVRISGRPVEE